MQSNPDALQRAVFAVHKRDPRKSACRKRSPHLASILCGTSNLELTIMPGRDHESGRSESQVTGACCRSSAKINSIPIALHPPRMLTSEDIRPYDIPY